MREKYVFLGGVLIILGVVLFVYGHYLIQSVQAYDMQGIPISQFLMTIDENTRHTYQLGQITYILGIVIGIIGACLMIVGGFIPDEKPIPKSPSVSHDEAQNILRTRYAKGEVTKAQYEQMKKDLEK